MDAGACAGLCSSTARASIVLASGAELVALIAVGLVVMASIVILAVIIGRQERSSQTRRTSMSTLFHRRTLHLRADRAERHRAIDLLTQHWIDGRLTTAEWDRRADAAGAATFRRELKALFHDLPQLDGAER